MVKITLKKNYLIKGFMGFSVRVQNSHRQTPNDGSVLEVSKYVGQGCEVWMGCTFSGQSGEQCVIALQSEHREILPVHGSMGFYLKEQDI